MEENRSKPVFPHFSFFFFFFGHLVSSGGRKRQEAPKFIQPARMESQSSVCHVGEL